MGAAPAPGPRERSRQQGFVDEAQILLGHRDDGSWTKGGDAGVAPLPSAPQTGLKEGSQGQTFGTLPQHFPKRDAIDSDGAGGADVGRKPTRLKLGVEALHGMLKIKGGLPDLVDDGQGRDSQAGRPGLPALAKIRAQETAAEREDALFFPDGQCPEPIGHTPTSLLYTSAAPDPQRCA